MILITGRKVLQKIFLKPLRVLSLSPADRRELKTLPTNLKTQNYIVAIDNLVTLEPFPRVPFPGWFWGIVGQKWDLAIALEEEVTQRPSLHQGCHRGALWVPAHLPLLVLFF